MQKIFTPAIRHTTKAAETGNKFKSSVIDNYGATYF